MALRVMLRYGPASLYSDSGLSSLAPKRVALPALASIGPSAEGGGSILDEVSLACRDPVLLAEVRRRPHGVDRGVAGVHAQVLPPRESVILIGERIDRELRQRFAGS
jgi:hypothetical protein